MKTFAIALLAATIASARELKKSDDDADYVEFASKNGKSYSDWDEFTVRKAIWKKTQAKFQKFNQEPNKTSSVGDNFFSDLTDAEAAAYLGRGSGSSTFKMDPDEEKRNLARKPTARTCRTIAAPDNTVPLPRPTAATADVQETVRYTATLDWRAAGVVGTIRNQGGCGSCWSFAGYFAVEAADKLTNGVLQNFSEQAGVDCITSSYGCSGGWENHPIEYLMTGKRAILETNYPYTAANGTCQYNCKVKTGITCTGIERNGIYNQPSQTPVQMKAKLDISPMTITLSAGNTVFQYYTSGIISSTGCNVNIDHAIGVIGYGSDAITGLDYWVIRNSWGTTWGEGGYGRIAIDYSGPTGPTGGKGYCYSHTEMYRAIV